MNQNKRYILLNTSESAVLPDSDTLLPRDEVYEPLAQMIIEAVNKSDAANGKSLNELREHNAITIDGARGTGKTAVLVNLKSYLKDRDISNHVHILSPVDPTLLENCESLFLHIIVAAVLHDRDVKEQQRNKPDKARSLNQALEKLTQSLEAVETQQDRHGLDKVRAMYSNKQLADCVQDFFREVLCLLNKKLMILAIDDVDTSLNRAFENLEIVRRYLATPHVLPIVCGDRELYTDVTWRDFHGRLTKDSRYRRKDAYKKAIELASEYQRKVLPFPRRLTMPPVSKYWNQNNIYLCDIQKNEIITLRNFIVWLQIFLSGPVNGLEESQLSLPIPSIRALMQLVSHCSDLIPQLPVSIRAANNGLDVRKKWQNLPQEDFASFDRNIMVQRLADYFCYEPKGGIVYLLLLAKQQWTRSKVESSRQRSSIFDTPLFQPLTHTAAKFEFFDKTDNLSEWARSLAKRLPEEWLAGIKSQKTMLPYPLAEIGINSSKKWNYVKEINNNNNLADENKGKSIFLIDLLVQNNFYTNSKQTMLLNIGRIFELIIASINGPISEIYVNEILSRAPFFSAAALAPTKTILMDMKTSTGEYNSAETDFVERHDSSILIHQICKEINEWRNTNHIDEIEVSPWLVYKVFYNIYNQLSNGNKFPSIINNIYWALNMAAYAFYATWFSFAGFEKGELFNLPNVIATTNINPEKLKNYKSNDQFNVNVKPMLDTFGNENPLKAVSIVLKDHPLKKWIDEVIQFDWSNNEPDSTPSNNKSENKTVAPRKWLSDKLGIPLNDVHNPNAVEKALSTKSQTECKNLSDELSKKFRRKSIAKNVFELAYQKKNIGSL